MFLRMLRRFLLQAGFLVSPPTLSLGQTTGAAKWRERLRSRNDLLTIPDQLGTWGAMVDQRKYVGGSPEQLPMLATRLHMLGHRLQELFEAGDSAGSVPGAGTERGHPGLAVNEDAGNLPVAGRRTGRR